MLNFDHLRKTLGTKDTRTFTQKIIESPFSPEPNIFAKSPITTRIGNLNLPRRSVVFKDQPPLPVTGTIKAAPTNLIDQFSPLSSFISKYTPYSPDVFGQEQIAIEKAEREERLRTEGYPEESIAQIRFFPTITQMQQSIAIGSYRTVTSKQASKLIANANKLTWADISDITAGRVKAGPKFEAYKIVSQDKKLLKDALARKGKMTFAQTFKQYVDDLVRASKDFIDDLKPAKKAQPVKLLTGKTGAKIGNLNVPKIVQQAKTPAVSLVDDLAIQANKFATAKDYAKALETDLFETVRVKKKGDILPIRHIPEQKAVAYLDNKGNVVGEISYEYAIGQFRNEPIVRPTLAINKIESKVPGTGVGSNIVKAIKNLADSRNGDVIVDFVEPGSEGFWEKMGFDVEMYSSGLGRNGTAKYIGGKEQLTSFFNEAKSLAKPVATPKLQPEVPAITEPIAVETPAPVDKTFSAKEILDRRRGFIRAAQEQFGLSDADLRTITKRDIRLMNNLEFKKYIDSIRTKAQEISETRQVQNELTSQIREKNLNVEPLRTAMKMPPISKMSKAQLSEFDRTLQPYQKDDVFLSKRKLETIDRTELSGIKTYREATEILAKKLGVDPSELQNIKISELDRFRGDVSLAKRNPFFKMMTEETARLQLIRDAEYLDIEKELFKKANKLGIGKRFSLVPRQKNIAKWFDAKDKSKVQLTEAEAELVKFMQEEWSKARDYLIKVDAMSRGMNADNYFTHIRRGILEAVVEDGPIKAAKEMFKAYKQDELTFNILDDRTGEIMALDKFFQFAMRRTGGLKPTQNVLKAFQVYMKTFKKKQALDEIVPLIDIYAHSLTPKGMTKTGLLLHNNLIRFTKEWLNNKKGRKASFGGLVKQGGTLDLGLRAIKNFTSLMDIGLNLPVSVATQVGEQVVTYKLLGKGKYALAKARSATPKGKRIINKYRNFVGKNPWGELIEPAKGLGERLNEGIFSLFQDANVRRNKNFLLGIMSKAEYQAEKLSPQRLAELKFEMGRYGVIPGAKSIVGSTSIGGAWTQYKTWALPILRSELESVVNLRKLLTKDKKLGKEGALNLWRTIELVGIVSIIRGLIGEEEDDSMIGQIKSRAYKEMSTVWQALDPKLFLSAGRTASFLEDLGSNLSTLLKLEEYKSSSFGQYEEGDLKGVNRLFRQFTPRAIKQFETDKVKTAEDVKAELREDIESGKLSKQAAKEKAVEEMKKIQKALKESRFDMPEEEYKADLRERIKNNELTKEEAKAEAIEYLEENADNMEAEDDKSFIDKVMLYSKAIGTDPITAFNRIFTGQRIRRLDNGAIIVERMPFEESQSVRKSRGATKDLRLDHTIPLQLGGSNSEKNLKLVTLEDWEKYTIVENYLGDKLRAGDIKKKEAQRLIKGFKNGSITIEEIGL